MTFRNRIFNFLGINDVIKKQVLAGVVKELTQKSRTLNWQPKAIYRTRSDIKTWAEAQNYFENVYWPRTWAIQLLYKEIRLDALLTSQIENRKLQSLSADFILKNSAGDMDEESTLKLKTSKLYKDVTDAILESHYIGYSLIELYFDDNKNLCVSTLPRTNVVPQAGKFYEDFLMEENIDYRKLPEFGKWILEFNTNDIGLLNKAVPHVLFKRFCQSCWSELCEIYGIPPRVMKTNTQDTTMLARAESMMRDMGAAAWFIIDETESFEFAAGVSTNGDVYDKLIHLCNNEMSLLISGAIIGQDTKNGSNNKDQSAQEMQSKLVQFDLSTIQMYWNNIVLPALVKIGYLPDGLTLSYEPAEDTQQLFTFTQALLPFKEIDNDWLYNKFGVKITGNKEIPQLPPTNNNDKNLSAFFD